MWYMLHMDDGIIKESDTLSKLIEGFDGELTSISVCSYELRIDCINNIETYYIYCGKNLAIQDGFEWAFK